MLVWVCNSSHPPVRPASSQSRRHGVKSFFFFLCPLRQQRKKKEKPHTHTHTPKQTTNKPQITRDDRQGSTHVLGFRRTCCYGNAGQGAAAPCRATQPGMRGRVVQAVTPAPSPPQTAEEACVVGSWGPELPNFPRRDHVSQEHFLLPRGGWLGAPEAVFAALFRKQVSWC